MFRRVSPVAQLAAWCLTRPESQGSIPGVLVLGLGTVCGCSARGPRRGRWLSVNSLREGWSEIPEGMEDLREGMKSPGSPSVDGARRCPVTECWGLRSTTIIHFLGFCNSKKNEILNYVIDKFELPQYNWRWKEIRNEKSVLGLDKLNRLVSRLCNISLSPLSLNLLTDRRRDPLPLREAKQDTWRWYNWKDGRVWVSHTE